MVRVAHVWPVHVCVHCDFLAKVSVLEDGPLFCPVSLEKFVPPDGSLGGDGSSTLAGIIVGVDCVAF
jgi:hypothetical protein